jgi:hypothetical protein
VGESKYEKGIFFDLFLLVFLDSPHQEAHKNVIKKIEKNRFGFLVSAIGVQQHFKKTFCKKNVSKTFYKKIDKHPKPICFSICFNHVFGRFLVRGVLTHHKTNQTLVLFWLLTHPPTTGVTGFFAGPFTAAEEKNKKATYYLPTFLGVFLRFLGHIFWNHFYGLFEILMQRNGQKTG